MEKNNNKPDKLRIAVGSASKLGLRHIKMDAQPTNFHTLTYNSGGCSANCFFCPQSKYTYKILENTPDSQAFLSRVTWPAFDLKKILDIFNQKYSKSVFNEDGFQRICIQSLNYENFEEDIKYLLLEFNKVTSIPISIAVPPPETKDWVEKFKECGAERIAFAIDAATEDLFNQIKGKKSGGPYEWKQHIELLTYSVNIFGRGYVSTHYIVGFGESDYDGIKLISDMKKLGVLTGLFAFTPIKNTKFENRHKPSIIKFRKMQLGKYLIDTGKKNIDDFSFNDDGKLISFNIVEELFDKIIGIGTPYQTSGCPGCNRPYYTSTPREEQYNFPRGLTQEEKKSVKEELINFI